MLCKLGFVLKAYAAAHALCFRSTIAVFEALDREEFGTLVAEDFLQFLRIGRF